MATDNTIHYMRITLAYDQTKISSKFKTLNKSFPRLRFHLLQLTFLVSNWPKMRRVKKKKKQTLCHNNLQNNRVDLHSTYFYEIN